MDHAGHRERLRQRYKKEGLNGFSTHEVLELMLTYAIPRVNTNGPAHLLMDRFGSFPAVLEASPEELQQVPGIGPQAAVFLSMMMPVLRRYEQEKTSARARLDVYDVLADYCRSLFRGVNDEYCYLLCLDAKMTLIACVCLAKGTPAEVNIHPRMVVQELMRHSATGAVLCHNHPAGSPEPSQADVDVTAEISKVLSSLGIRLYDHVIISGNLDYSFRCHRLL